MSVFIPGISLPSGKDTIVIYSDGSMNLSGHYCLCGTTIKEIPQKAIEIKTPHGGLIDRSKIGLTNFEIFMFDGDFKEALIAYINKVESAEVVIEAEGLPE